MPPRSITPEEQDIVRLQVARARVALGAIEGYDQRTVDRLCQAVAWAGTLLDVMYQSTFSAPARACCAFSPT
jgi:hypothetical protein